MRGWEYIFFCENATVVSQVAFYTTNHGEKILYSISLGELDRSLGVVLHAAIVIYQILAIILK